MPRPGAHRSYGTKKQTGAQARTALTGLLYGCRDEQLATFTPEGLSASYAVPEATASDMLKRARASRGLV